MSSEDIQAAIEAHIHSLPDAPGQEGMDMGMIGDWVAVATMVRVDEVGHPVAEYYLLMRDGNMLPHVVKGMLYEGVDQADAGRTGAES